MPCGGILRVGLVIVTHNAAAFVGRCLRAVASQSRRPNRVIVVDNASDDATCAAVEETAAALGLTVEVVALAVNTGFARANNAAVGVLEGCDWVALLNPDAFPGPDWLEALVAAAARHPAAAALASRLMRDGAADVVDGAGDEYHASGLVWRSGHGCALAGVAGALDERQVFAACAAAAMYRRQDWIDAGGFDDRFFCYVEDVDLGFRLRLRQRECWYVPTAVAHHVGSAVTGVGSAFSVYHGHRNLTWTFVKNMPGPLLWRYLPWHVAVGLVGLVWFAARGRGGAYLAAKRDALLALPEMWRTRRQVQRTRTASAGEVRGQLNRTSLVARALERARPHRVRAKRHCY